MLTGWEAFFWATIQKGLLASSQKFKRKFLVFFTLRPYLHSEYLQHHSLKYLPDADNVFKSLESQFQLYIQIERVMRKLILVLVQLRPFGKLHDPWDRLVNWSKTPVMKPNFPTETRQLGYIPNQGILITLTSKIKLQFYCFWNGHFTFLSHHSTRPRDHSCSLMRGTGLAKNELWCQTNQPGSDSIPAISWL